MFGTTPSIPNYNIIFKKKSFLPIFRCIYYSFSKYTFINTTPIILEYEKLNIKH